MKQARWLYAHGMVPPSLKWGKGPAPEAWLATLFRRRRGQTSNKMTFARHLDHLAAAIAWLAGLLPRATADLWRPAAYGLQHCTTAASPARVQRTTARLRRWAFGPKTDWP